MAELSQSEVIYFVLIGTLGMLSLTGGIGIFIAVYQKRIIQEQEKRRMLEIEYEQKMIQSQIESQEIERKRIAADLHDSIGSLLWAAKLNVAFLGRSITLPGNVKESLDETMKILDQSIDSVKRISWELTPEAFQHSGLASSIREMSRRLDGKQQTLILNEIGTVGFWHDDRALMVFRIVQELVNNAIKHSQGNTITITSTWTPEQLVILVEDNGIGFTLDDKVRNGVGWWNITHRADRINAQVKLLTKTPGAAVELTVPLSA